MVRLSIQLKIDCELLQLNWKIICSSLSEAYGMTYYWRASQGAWWRLAMTTSNYSHARRKLLRQSLRNQLATMEISEQEYTNNGILKWSQCLKACWTSVETMTAKRSMKSCLLWVANHRRHWSLNLSAKSCMKWIKSFLTRQSTVATFSPTQLSLAERLHGKDWYWCLGKA